MAPRLPSAFGAATAPRRDDRGALRQEDRLHRGTPLGVVDGVVDAVERVGGWRGARKLGPGQPWAAAASDGSMPMSRSFFDGVWLVTTV